MDWLIDSLTKWYRPLLAWSLERRWLIVAVSAVLVGLVSGAGGLYLAKVDLSKAINRTRLTAIGMMLSAFVVCLLIGTVIGIYTLWVLFQNTATDFFAVEPVELRPHEGHLVP